MTLPDGLTLRVAGEPDLPAIAALRASVGWAAHEWALRAALEPPHARCLVATDAAGRIVGVGSGIAYGALGIVGNMVVAETHRRSGVGSAILEAAMAHLEARGCTRLELYATRDGRPLYASRGFDLVDPSAMARIPRREGAPVSPIPISDGRPEAVDILASYDAPRFGGDRHPLLAMMLADPRRPVLVAWDGDAIAGYAWLRPDGQRIGPFVADTPDVAAALLGEAFRRAPDAGDLSVNLPMANQPGTDWLRGLGVELDPWDGRMARGAPVPRRDETIYGNVVGALG